MPESITDVAKQQLLAYNDKNWDRVREVVAPTIVYDEVGTHRKLTGVDDLLASWKGWATAIPDSEATIHTAVESGNTVTIELTWHGTHQGPLVTPNGTIEATGKPIELRACQVIQVADGKTTSIRQYFDVGSLIQQITG